jgi:phospholipid N-methyltransferase
VYATYSPEDNKLRLYPNNRLPRELYDRVKAAGFKWAPKQELFVAPAWTPHREDMLIELCGEIGDEDTSLVARAEERAERFEDHSDKRADDAHRAKATVDAIADNIPLGQPILVGHHSERHARKHAEQIENGMRRAVQMWATSRYWLERAQGAIQHAKYKERPDVRARRIKGLEADKRKHERNKADFERYLRLWSKEGLGLEEARAVANVSYLYVCHPQGKSYGWTAWEVLRPDEERYTDCPAWTVEQCQAKAKEVYPHSIEHENRWIAHLENRLAYERAMMEESGGIAADKVKPEKGGACKCWASPRGGWSMIQKVNKVSVTLLDNWGNGGRNFTRTIPFDKLSALMTKADVDAKRKAGLLVENEYGAAFVKDAPQEQPKHRAEPEPTPFDAMADTLKAGVKVVSAPQLFPTPPNLADRMIELADIRAGQTILEPSAGTGALLEALQRKPLDFMGGLTIVEVNRSLCDALTARGYHPVCADFLECNGELGTFDRVVMNPPFTNAQDIKHIEHALAKLKPAGRLVALCANGPHQREKLKPLALEWHELPAGTFAGTNVNAALLVIDAEA